MKKDLEVIVHSDLGLRKQYIEVRSEANRVLGLIFMSVQNINSQITLKLYLAIVKPHLDYAVLFWSPYYRNDLRLLKSVQRRMSERIQGMRSIPYEVRLKVLNLHSLKSCRL